MWSRCRVTSGPPPASAEPLPPTRAPTLFLAPRPNARLRGPEPRLALSPCGPRDRPRALASFALPAQSPLYRDSLPTGFEDGQCAAVELADYADTHLSVW